MFLRFVSSPALTQTGHAAIKSKQLLHLRIA
jgi:hypothetical protein